MHSSLTGMSNEVDLLFAIDGSRMVNLSTYEKMKKFVKGALNMYNISALKTHVGILSFGGDTNNIALPLKDGISKPLVDQTVDSLKRCGGQRHMNKAIRFVADKMFTTENGGRPNAGKVLVLLTAGRNSAEGKEDLPKAARKLKENGVDVFVIGLGTNVDDDELIAIASEKDDIAKVNTVDDLPTVLGSLEKLSGMSAG